MARTTRSVLCLFAALPAAASCASAAVNLAFEPSTQSVPVGATVSIGIYAISDVAATQALGSFQVIFSWNPALLQLTGTSSVGAAPLLGSGFFSDPYGINESALPSDGNAMFVGLGPLGSYIPITQAGTLMSTLTFKALAPTASTPVAMLASAGSPIGYTAVYDGTVPNTVITGSLAGDSVRIVPAPSSGGLLMYVFLRGGRRRRPC